MKQIKILLLVASCMLSALLLASCGGNNTETANSQEESAVSHISTEASSFETSDNIDVSNASEPSDISDSSEELNSSETLESIDFSSIYVSSEESSEYTESSNEPESSEDASYSEPESSKEQETSKDPDSENDFFLKIPEKYNNLSSYKALNALSQGIKDSFQLYLSGKSTSGNYIEVQNVSDYKNHKELFQAKISREEQVIISMKSLTIGEKTYAINDTNKSYSVIEQSLLGNTLGMLSFENVQSVETTNEIVESETYTVDWFVLVNGYKHGIFTKDNNIKYISVQFSQAETALLELKTSSDISNVNLDIPDDYVLV